MNRCLTTVRWKISYGAADDRLRELYIPALSRSVSYARTAGFFSSGALAVAAAGLAHLVRAGGRMRLLVGAALSEDDVRAIERGEDALGQAVEQRLLEALAALERDPTDLARRRLEVLAWMVAHGTLEIRVVLPTGPDGRPLPAHQAADYFHPKEGLFTDACGHQLAFSGSANETPSGWLYNYEQLMVYTSWEASRPYLLQVAERIERLWQGREEGWCALAVPEAVRQRLIRLAPDEPPDRDPCEDGGRRLRAIPADQRERILFQFLRDAPLLPGGERVGIQTAGVRPWPHQARIVRQVVERFPERFLLADEVGLGKTIEAGLVLRALLLSRQVRRCLILTPKSVLRQWQEELYEKFALNVPRYDGERFWDYFGEIPAPPGNPWNAYPVLLASSQLAKRRDRVMEVLAAEPWDLVVVDEAHHARRREFRTDRYRPNRLLMLLEGDGQRAGLSDRTRGLLLLTATPLQIHPVEVFDLMRQLQLPGLWAASERRFLRFFEELRAARAGQPVDWALLLRLAADGVKGISIEALVGAEACERVGAVEWNRIRDLLSGRRPPETAASLSPSAQAVLLEACRRASPLGQRMFRTTREQLRRYHRQGLLRERIPDRDPEPRWIRMSAEEWGLYQRVEDYVSDFYERYEGERKGLGFVMTVYRRRLTSSFAALVRSLERRRRDLLGRRGPVAGLIDEDFEEADLNSDVAEELEAQGRGERLSPGLQRLLEVELGVLERLLGDVQRLGHDTKFECLVEDLRTLLGQRDRVAVFVHYTDTMDALRDRLVGIYGRRLACYSGRGGERWDGSRWAGVSKEEVKEAFRAGEIQVLLCTDAASEGLNLQTCGVLINYDMPWNPMRVEQRIGRFDRIGQRYPDVWIRHYFVMGPDGEATVEARVYQALEARIGWFRAVVGELQPILARVPEVIEQAVTTRRADRGRVLDRLIAELQREIEERENSGFSLDELAELPVSGDEGLAPLTLRELEAALRGSSLGSRFTPHRQIAGAFELDLGGQIWAVTFDPEVADAHPGRVRLLTPGEPLLVELLALVDPPVGEASGRGVIRAVGGNAVCWYRPEGERVEPLSTLGALRAALEGRPEEVAAGHLECARRELGQSVEAQARRAEAWKRRQDEERLSALQERARLVLALAVACRMALAGIHDREIAWRAVVGSGYPFAGLARLVGQPAASDMGTAVVDAGTSPDQARRQLERAREEAKGLLHALARQRDPAVSPATSGVQIQVEIYSW